MKSLTTLLLSSVLLVSAVACSDASKTSQSAPDDTNQAVQVPSQDTVQSDLKDGQSETRRNQLDADIRAREERRNMLGRTAENRDEDNLASEVRSKLEANIPNGQLAVEATEDGTVTVTGTVPNRDQLQKIDRLAREIDGVKNVNVRAVVAQARPQAENESTQ